MLRKSFLNAIILKNYIFLVLLKTKKINEIATSVVASKFIKIVAKIIKIIIDTILTLNNFSLENYITLIYRELNINDKKIITSQLLKLKLIAKKIKLNTNITKIKIERSKTILKKILFTRDLSLL